MAASLPTAPRDLPHWKQALLHAYYAALWSRRVTLWRRWQTDGRAPVMALMYHRIADDRATPWTISNRTFAQQIDWLARHFDVIDIATAAERLRTANTRPAVVITFDDGYADNCTHALPLLIERRLPCTYFVTSQNVLLGRPFAHDEAIGARNLRPNTVAEIRTLADAGIEIAGHTRTHADLGQITDPNVLEQEIAGGALELEAITGRPVRYFAFPFGQHNNLSQVAFSIARRAGLECVASAYGGYNFPGDDPFHLQRFAVDDDLIRLKNWCGVDPRKQRLHPRFDYPTEQINQHEQTLAATAQ